MNQGTLPSGGIQQLVAMKKGDRSFARLSLDCGGRPTGPALQKLTTSPLKSFPDPETIRGLSRGLNLPIRQIVEACARSVGLDISAESDDVLPIVGGRRLPESSQALLISMAREMLAMQEGNPGTESNQNEQDSYGLAAREGDPNIGPYDLPE